MSIYQIVVCDCEIVVVGALAALANVEMLSMFMLLVLHFASVAASF